MILVLAACTRTTSVRSFYVINTSGGSERCPYTWQDGDYWEFLAWALLDDVSSASALAITAGYTPVTFPVPGAEIVIPMAEEYSDAARNRMDAARLVRDATQVRDTDRALCMELLEAAVELDPVWSVPSVDITVLLLEEGRSDEALELLSPLSYKNIPATIMAGISWRKGNTAEALEHLQEALATERPLPEVLAAAGIVWSVTGNRQNAMSAFRRLLENPDAPSELRIRALEFALMLEER